MIRLFWILLTMASFICDSRQTEARLKSFCYFTNWSNKLASVDARFDVHDIDPKLCTHIIYAFPNINKDRLRLERKYEDDDNGSLSDPKGRYFQINKLKEDNPHLKTLLSIGGQSGSDAFQHLVASENSMREFSRNCIIYLRDKGFNGIDIDWEWPGNTNMLLVVYAIFAGNIPSAPAYGVYVSQLADYVKAGFKYQDFLKEGSYTPIMRSEFDDEALRTSKDPLILTAAVGVGEQTINTSYNIPEISKVVDYLNVMSYDFHGMWSKVTSFSGPLYSRASNIQFNQKLSQAWAIQRWIDGGAPPEKLVMGMTAAALTFTLYNRTSNFAGVGARAERPGNPGPYIQQEGHVTYYRVCEIVEQGAVEHWDDEQKMVFTSVGDEWYGYGTTSSMREKVDFAYSKGLGGVMFWSLDLDDFKGDHCSKGPYPLLTAINKAIESGDPTKTTPPITTTTTATTSTTTTTTTPSTDATTTPIDCGLHQRTKKRIKSIFSMLLIQEEEMPAL